MQKVDLEIRKIPVIQSNLSVICSVVIGVFPVSIVVLKNVKLSEIFY